MQRIYIRTRTSQRTWCDETCVTLILAFSSHFSTKTTQRRQVERLCLSVFQPRPRSANAVEQSLNNINRIHYYNMYIPRTHYPSAKHLASSGVRTPTSLLTATQKLGVWHTYAMQGHALQVTVPSHFYSPLKKRDFRYINPPSPPPLPKSRRYTIFVTYIDPNGRQFRWHVNNGESAFHFRVSCCSKA